MCGEILDIDIKKLIDSCIGKDIHEIETNLNTLLDALCPYVLQNYINSREVMQGTISQLDRINDVAVPFLMSKLLSRINQLVDRFEKPIDGYDDYIKVEWGEDNVKCILHRMMPYLKGENNIASPQLEMANSLSIEERRQMASFIIDSIQRYGVHSQWDKDTIENHILYFRILYSFCKIDNQMDWLFHFAENFVDRLATSQLYQPARDIAESLLMIGYQEKMESEAYLCAARTYTILNQPLAGLLYMEMAMRKKLQQKTSIPYKESFEILWMVLKLARGIRFCSEKYLAPITRAFDTLNPLPYDILSFYHTYFSVLFFAKQDRVLDDMADFLDSHREEFFKNLEHSAMPWITLVANVKMNCPSADISRFNLYIEAAKSVVDYKSNALYLDLLSHKNEADHLKELMVRLNTTRNVADYSHDNTLAMLFAKSLLDKAFLCKNPSHYLLGMHVRADFTFVRQSIRQNGLYGRAEIIDVNGKEYHLPIEDTKVLEDLMQQGEDNEVLWIGKGQRNLYSMLLLKGEFSFETFDSWSCLNIAALQSGIIRNLTYERDVKKPGQPIYSKDNVELEQEAEDLKQKLAACKIPVEEGAERLLIAKDMDVAAYPHQLLLDANGDKFVGCQLPSCNIISTEVFIKTNFEEPFHKDFTCAYWSPFDSQEFTFAMIKGYLEETLNKYHFVCNDQTAPLRPINSEINIACAHGGADISNTSWFYADDKPIVETDKIIGKGKLLILFVCHSGTISRPDYDNAMHTLIKRYIRMGYSSVIAPMWSLNTEILPTWLEVFMESVHQGEFVIDAVFKANMAVKEKYISPVVYACLHLFGNPFLQIGDRPVLGVIEN